MVSDYIETYARTMIVNERYLSQDELKYVYDSAEGRMEYHPELAEKYRKIIDNYSFYTDKNTAIEKAIELSKSSLRHYQVWAKVGKDEEFYYIEDYYIVSNDYKILIAAEYIGMEQIVM